MFVFACKNKQKCVRKILMHMVNALGLYAEEGSVRLL